MGVGRHGRPSRFRYCLWQFRGHVLPLHQASQAARNCALPPRESLRREWESVAPTVMDQTSNSAFAGRIADARLDHSPILIVPYMWIGAFVRCHTVIQLLRARFPERPVDMLASTLCAPLTDYMPGLRQAIVVDLPRNRLALRSQFALAARLKRAGYGTALV